MVTSHKMSENEMGNRGSKSVIPTEGGLTVKEQRVDGSCIGVLYANVKVYSMKIILIFF
jgi:hypothetical protein